MRTRAVVLALALAACTATGPSPVIDGWPIGEPYACTNSWCAPYMDIAIAGFAARDPGHPEIASATLHRLGVMIGDDGNPVSLAYSGGQPSVVLFRLAGGSVRAIGVKYIGVSREASALNWGPGSDHQAP